MLITMKALRGKWKADKLTHISSNCHKRNYILLIPRMYKHISPFSKSSFPLLCHFCTLMVSGSIWQQELLLALPPFLWLLLPCIRVDLVPHPAQDIGGGFSGHNEWLNHCWRQLTENSTHCPRHPTLFVLPGGCVIDGQCCVCDPLCMETPKNPIKRQFCNVNVVWVNHIYFLYLFYHCVGFGYTFPQINGLMSKSVMSVPFYPLCVSFIRHWRHHVIGRLSCCLRWHKQWNKIVRKALEVNADFFLFTVERWVYLDGPHHPVGELQSSHSCRRSKGGSAALKPTDYPTVFPVLLNWEPDQVPESLNWTDQNIHLKNTPESVRAPFHLHDMLAQLQKPWLNQLSTFCGNKKHWKLLKSCANRIHIGNLCKRNGFLIMQYSNYRNR